MQTCDIAAWDDAGVHIVHVAGLTGMDSHLPLYDGRVPLLAHFNYG